MKLLLLIAIAASVTSFTPRCFDLPPPPGCILVCEEPVEPDSCPVCEVVCPGGGQ